MWTDNRVPRVQVPVPKRDKRLGLITGPAIQLIIYDIEATDSNNYVVIGFVTQAEI
jgi:hypothetical protein